MSWQIGIFHPLRFASIIMNFAYVPKPHPLVGGWPFPPPGFTLGFPCRLPWAMWPLYISYY
jgi:hypothetical protein